MLSHHGKGKFLASLLNSVAQYEYVVQDSFEGAVKKNSISFEVDSFVPFEVEFVFTNVPLKKITESILIYNSLL